MSASASYIILLSVVLIISLAIFAFVYWYVNVRCAYNKEVNEFCLKDCDCANGKKCGYNSGSPLAVPVCCPNDVIVVDGKAYCNMLQVNMPCLNDAMCASGSCLNNVCTTSSGSNPNPGGGGGGGSGGNNGGGSSGGTFTRGTPCSSNSQCLGNLICAAGSNLPFAPTICCRASPDPSGLAPGCGDFPAGSQCNNSLQCNSEQCDPFSRTCL